MIISEWLTRSISKLNEASVPTPHLDAELLLADELGKDRSWLLAHQEFKLSSAHVKKLNTYIKRRAQHEPIAYIRGKQEFYGHEFVVSPDTLTPRPETETMIELLLDWVKHHASKIEGDLQIVDVGTGSGCIAISAALEIGSKVEDGGSKVNYLGIDISAKALAIARKNAQRLGADVTFKKLDLLSETVDLQPSTFNIILANLPYVPTDFSINLAASHEPAFAIFGGEDGLDYYRALFSKTSIGTYLILTESLPSQHDALASIAKDAGYLLADTQDFIQQFEKADLNPL